MFRPFRVAAAVAASALLVFAATALAGKTEIKPIVKLPKTWEAAVAEGKLLNLPIVVHSHGFY
jgi:hypothetical protein